MKLLLTSGGLKNQTLIDEFIKLVGKPAKEIKVAFIPTAANVEEGNKDWQIDNLWEFKNLVGEVDIIELTALSNKDIQKRLEWADAIVVGGGHPEYLSKQITKSGLKEMLPELLKSRVYVGISAGSMVMGPSIGRDLSMKFYNERMGECLGYVNFWIKAHMNKSEARSKKHYSNTFKNSPKKLFAIDDQSAIKVVDDEIQPVGEGEWIEFGE